MTVYLEIITFFSITLITGWCKIGDNNDFFRLHMPPRNKLGNHNIVGVNSKITKDFGNNLTLVGSVKYIINNLTC